MAEWRRVRPGDVLRAAVELGLARLRLEKHRPMVEQSGQLDLPLDRRKTALVNRVAYVIPRVAARLPWRADCLVQALAAERWLNQAGIATRLNLGVPRNKRPVFEAHAWLTAGDRVVTGGDIAGYMPFAS